MPQVVKQIVREVSTSGNEMVVRIELTLNINLNQEGNLEISAETKPPAFKSKIDSIPEFIMPDLSGTEIISFGKEV